MHQRGIIHLLPLFLVFLLAIGVLVVSVGGKNNITDRVQRVVFNKTPEPASVALTTSYENPFDSGSQYVNPFSTYKNPFDLVE